MANEKLEKLKTMRKENLLDENQLEQAAGGSCYEMSDDSKFLNVLLKGRPGCPDRYGAMRCCADLITGIDDELKTAWKSVGIDFKPHSGAGTDMLSTYMLNGKQITHAEAWAHAEKVVGRHLEKHEWDW